MNNFRSYLESLDDLFADLGKSKIIRTETKIIPYKLKLWRGFNHLESLNDEYYILNPEKSEQGMLWWTHPYINHYNPIQYAIDHGNYLATYELPCKKHVQTNYWDDNTKSENIPDYWQSDPTKNSNKYAGIELPDGWLFSYKTEKFVGCTKKLPVLKSSVVSSADYPD